MTDLADRLLAQLRRLGSMSATAIPLSFGVTEDEAGAAIKELLDDKRAYRAGARVFASAGPVESSSPPMPIGQQREIQTPATPPPRAARPVAAADPRESTREAAMAETKVCTKCSKRKPIDDFYAKQRKCKRCFLDDQKASKAARDEGNGSAKPKSAAPAKSTKSAGEKRSNGAPKIEDLAVINIPAGFRLGPLHKTAAGLVHMPFFVDVSFGQLLELADLAKAVA